MKRLDTAIWFDEECRQAAIEKNDAYQATLKSAATQAVCEKYRENALWPGPDQGNEEEKDREKRREEQRMFRRKKHEFLKAECEEIEMQDSRNDVRQFFQKIKRTCEGFKTGASLCKDQDGNLVTDIKSSLDL